MILGTGIDVATIIRVERFLEAHRAELPRIFTARERAVCDRAPAGRRAARYAGAFAGKEAVMKALGTGWRSDVTWCDIDTPPDDGCGEAVLLAGALHAARRQGISRVLVSVSLTREAAVATAVAEGDGCHG